MTHAQALNATVLIWGVRINLTLLYPTARPPAPVERSGLVK
jgi:hypothetical protein